MYNNTTLNEIAGDLASAATHLTDVGLMRGWAGQLSARYVQGDTYSIILKRSGGSAVDPADYCCVDKQGNNLGSAETKPSLVTHVHCAIYASRPDIHVVTQCRGLYADAVAAVLGRIPLSLETYWALKAEPVVIDVDVLRSNTMDQYADRMAAEVSDALAKDHGAATAVCIPFYGMWVAGASTIEVVERALTLEDLAKSVYLHISLSNSIGKSHSDLPVWLHDILRHLSRPGA